MTIKEKVTEGVAAASVVLILAGVPGLLWYWRAVYVPGRHPPGSKIIDMTAIADGGIWTTDRVVGYNYWWKKPARLDTLRFTQGDHVVLRLHSPDVQHSFSIPDLNVGPVDIGAGHTVELAFDANRVGEWKFFCVQVCGRDHGRLEGYVVIAPRAAAQAQVGGVAAAAVSARR
jgi:heme/copper-type cytochrome/quinol oxidase subunit 2